jgi:acyl carrier protein
MLPETNRRFSRIIARYNASGGRGPSGMIEEVRELLRSTLQLGDRADRLTASSALLGSIPEFDSMAVVTVLTMIEEEFGISVADDEVSAEVFETLGSLAEFVERKVRV